MSRINVNIEVEESDWQQLETLAAERNWSMSRILDDAVADYVRSRQKRSQVLSQLEKSILENGELGQLLSR